MPKKCAENKIKNPRTKRCVKKDGAIGRKIRGVAKKYMDTPALRAAIAKEKARGKKSFTIPKKKPKKPVVKKPVVKKAKAKNIKIPSFSKYFNQERSMNHFVFRKWEGLRDTFEEDMIYDMSERQAHKKADIMARKELRIKYDEVKKKKYKSMKEFEEAYKNKLGGDKKNLI